MSNRHLLTVLARQNAGERLDSIAVSQANFKDESDARFQYRESRRRHEELMGLLADRQSGLREEQREELEQQRQELAFELGRLERQLAGVQQAAAQERATARRQRQEHAAQLRRVESRMDEKLEELRCSASFVYRACRVQLGLEQARETQRLAQLERELAPLQALWKTVAAHHSQGLMRWRADEASRNRAARQAVQNADNWAQTYRNQIATLRDQVPPAGKGWFAWTRARNDALRASLLDQIQVLETQLAEALRQRVRCPLTECASFVASAVDERRVRQELRDQAAQKWLTEQVKELLLREDPPARDWPEIDFELAKALEDAQATEYPGLGPIPGRKELPRLLVELRELQCLLSGRPDPQPDFESRDALVRYWFSADDDFDAHATGGFRDDVVRQQADTDSFGGFYTG